MSDLNITRIIERKRGNQKLSKEEIHYFVSAVARTTLPEAEVPNEIRIDRAQIGAMLMAIYFNGLDREESIELTVHMKNSGYIFSWPKEWSHFVVDKHSTGGVGDKISLVLAPALAALGLKVPMISGRSLGHTGGTLDKLESIPGFRALLSKEEIYNIIETTGCCIIGQTEDCVPADKVLYQCREITATVTCPPLIVASIASKKLSEGTKALVYDVKYGKGSVFSSKEEAIATARSLVEFSEGTKATALLTSMENPLGRTIGNSLEVLEAVECLQGGGPLDIKQLTCALGSELLCSTNFASKSDGENQILEAIMDGRALKKFHDMIIQQGVSLDVAKELCYGDAISTLPKTQHETEICYHGEGGVIQEINPLALAQIWKAELFESNQHPGVGLILIKVVGQTIKTGEPWLKLHHQCNKITDETLKLFKDAICVGTLKREIPLVDRRIYFSDEFKLLEEKL